MYVRAFKSRRLNVRLLDSRVISVGSLSFERFRDFDSPTISIRSWLYFDEVSIFLDKFTASVARIVHVQRGCAKTFINNGHGGV